MFHDNVGQTVETDGFYFLQLLKGDTVTLQCSPRMFSLWGSPPIMNDVQVDCQCDQARYSAYSSPVQSRALTRFVGV
jgi:hypothetical protein